MRTPFVAGNWKMHKTVVEACLLADAIRERIGFSPAVEVAVAPPFTALSAVGARLRGSPVVLAAQNAYWEEHGAFTGEVSAPMLLDVGCRYVIVGHSERRQLFGETDETVRRRLAAVLGQRMRPIVCVGETLAEREAGRTAERVSAQLRGALGELSAPELTEIVVAYEPVWAIGTGRTASAAEAQEVHAHLRALLAEIGGADVAARVRILYGGSVKPANAAALFGQTDVDGALVGGASLEPESFLGIVQAANESHKRVS